MKMKIRKVVKADNALDDILDGLYSLTDLSYLRRVLTHCSDGELDSAEYHIKEAIFNGQKALKLIAAQRKNNK